MKNFSLLADISEPCRRIDPPARVRLGLCGLGLVAGQDQEVLAGEKIAVSEAGWTGDLHSPVAGKIMAVRADHVDIETNAQTPFARAETTALDGEVLNNLPQDLLPTVLSSLGLDTRGLVRAENLIVNAVNPEPGISAFGQIMADFPDELEAGLKLARTIISPNNVFLAAATGQDAQLAGLPVARTAAVYPAGIDALAAFAATGREDDADTVVLSVARLLDLGRAALYGTPAIETVMTIAGVNYIVPIGTPVSALPLPGLDGLEQGDRIILGGPMRGRAEYDPMAPVAKGDYGAFLIKAGAYPPVTDRSCIGCGQCARYCPARIQVNIMARFCEFGLYDKALAHGLDSCFECGLCAYWCPARRPLVQYIRLAKSQLLAAGTVAGPEDLTPGLRGPLGAMPGHLAEAGT